MNPETKVEPRKNIGTVRPNIATGKCRNHCSEAFRVAWSCCLRASSTLYLYLGFPARFQSFVAWPKGLFYMSRDLDVAPSCVPYIAGRMERGSFTVCLYLGFPSDSVPLLARRRGGEHVSSWFVLTSQNEWGGGFKHVFTWVSN